MVRLSLATRLAAVPGLRHLGQYHLHVRRRWIQIQWGQLEPVLSRLPRPLTTSMRPLVLALNPSVDVEWRVAQVRWEEKNEILSERRWPGGKGVNVARWLKHLGARPQLLIPLGGQTGRELAAGLHRARISTCVLP